MENVVLNDIEADNEEYFIEPESLEMALEFSKRYTRLLLERKNVNNDIKALRKEFNEQGLPTNIVLKAFNAFRKEKKETNKDEIQSFKYYIAKNGELQTLLNELESTD